MLHNCYTTIVSLCNTIVSSTCDFWTGDLIICHLIKMTCSLSISVPDALFVPCQQTELERDSMVLTVRGFLGQHKNIPMSERAHKRIYVGMQTPASIWAITLDMCTILYISFWAFHTASSLLCKATWKLLSKYVRKTTLTPPSLPLLGLGLEYIEGGGGGPPPLLSSNCFTVLCNYHCSVFQKCCAIILCATS